jgi:hypothetical protein
MGQLQVLRVNFSSALISVEVAQRNRFGSEENKPCLQS